MGRSRLDPRSGAGNDALILLTHLHLDHIQGVMFFAPAFRPESEITIWGPASPEASLQDRVARYISAPLAPVEVRELPSIVSFRDAEQVEWEIGSARIRAQAVNHRGPTLGYRIEDDNTVLCYIPDHEPGLGALGGTGWAARAGRAGHRAPRDRDLARAGVGVGCQRGLSS